MLPDETSKRFVAVLNKKIPIGQLLNALGHMTAGLAGGFGIGTDMCFLQYADKDGGKHPNISHYPFIVLRADNSSQIRKVRQEALVQNLTFTDFTSTMTIGTSQQQLDATQATDETNLEYFGICLFGETAVMAPLTRKFSLFVL